MTQTQFIKRLERAEKALDLLERRRAFFASNDRKVDFSRLNSVEMGCIDIYFSNTGLNASGLEEDDQLVLDEIFEKAAGIRDSIDIEIDFIVNKSGKTHFTLKRSSEVAPWEKTIIHRYGRYLALLQEAVRSDPVLNPPPPPPPPQPTREEKMRQIEINTARVEWILDPSEEKKQIWLALVAEDKRLRQQQKAVKNE